MAVFQLDLPNDLIKEFEKLDTNYEDIFGAMTKAGAEVVAQNVRSNAPPAMKNSGVMNCLKLSRVYKTPSDDGINTKVMFSGYYTNEEGRVTPAPLIANLFEYGRSNSPFPKHPFFRKSFVKGAIEQAMLKAQKEKSGGILDDK